MKKIFIMLLFLVCCDMLYAQDAIPSLTSQDTIKDDLDRYNDIFLGTWIAVHGDDTYEVKLEKRMMYFEPIDKYAMMVLGSIKKIRKGKIIYDRKISNTNVRKASGFPLCGCPRSSSVLSLLYEEPGEKKQLGKVEFTLSADQQTATWKLRGTAELIIINIREYDRFEIPYEMTFKRKRAKNAWLENDRRLVRNYELAFDFS